MNYWFLAFNVFTLAALTARIRRVNAIRRTEMQLDPVVRIRKQVADRLKRYLPLSDIHISGVTYSGSIPGWLPSELNSLISTIEEIHTNLTKEQ